MAKSVTAQTTLVEIEAMAEEYRELLAKSNIPMNVEQTRLDMIRRVAELNNTTPEDWLLTQKPQDPPPPPKAKATKKKDRGTVTEVDRDYFWVDPKNAQIGATWIKLRKEMGIVMNMLVIGPSGCGKTEGIARLGEMFELPVYKVDCASITTPDKWVGHKELVATEHGQETVYIKSQFLKWLAAEDCEPGIVLLDEVNRLQATLLNTLIPALDGSKSIWIPDLGIYSPVHPDVMIAATANLGVGYTGTHSLDIAFQDRFGAIMESTFPPEQEEVTILMRRAGLDEARAKVLVAIARKCRDKANDGTLNRYVSTRAIIDAAYWTQSGMRIGDACDATFVKKFSGEGGVDSPRHVVSQIVLGMAGSQ